MKLLVIDDDAAIRDAVGIALSSHWPESKVLSAEDGETGLSLFFSEGADVVVLDIRLPGMSGLEVLERLREGGMAPVLMLSALYQEADIVRALEMGADDYLTKPCSYSELGARVQALLRRSEQATVHAAQHFSAEGLTIHFPTQEVEIDGRSVPLTNTEYKLLYYLVCRPGHVVAHRDLLRAAWGSEAYGADVVRVYISRLRSKIEPDRENPRFIITKPGVGYMFAGRPTDAKPEDEVESAHHESADRPRLRVLDPPEMGLRIVGGTETNGHRSLDPQPVA